MRERGTKRKRRNMKRKEEKRMKTSKLQASWMRNDFRWTRPSLAAIFSVVQTCNSKQFVTDKDKRL